MRVFCFVHHLPVARLPIRCMIRPSMQRMRSISMATIDLNELRKEIEADRKSLAEKEAVVRFLERREGKKEPSPVSAPLADGVIQLGELIPDIGKRTLVAEVKDVVSRFGHQEFSVVHVDTVMKQRGLDIKGKSPRSRIAVALGKLEEDGVLVKTFQGKGNVPNKYKLKEAGEDLV